MEEEEDTPSSSMEIDSHIGDFVLIEDYLDRFLNLDISERPAQQQEAPPVNTTTTTITTTTTKTNYPQVPCPDQLQIQISKLKKFLHHGKYLLNEANTPEVQKQLLRNYVTIQSWLVKVLLKYHPNLKGAPLQFKEDVLLLCLSCDQALRTRRIPPQRIERNMAIPVARPSSRLYHSHQHKADPPSSTPMEAVRPRHVNTTTRRNMKLYEGSDSLTTYPPPEVYAPTSSSYSMPLRPPPDSKIPEWHDLPKR